MMKTDPAVVADVFHSSFIIHRSSFEKGALMFVPVACLRCGKLFQVPPEAAGTDVTCPWCREPTPALPVASVPPAAPAAAAPEPLSLDDAEPLAPAAPAVRPAPAVAVAPKAVPAAPRKPVSPPLVLAVLGGMAILAAATVLVLGYRSGRVSTSGWGEFTAPDGSFTGTFPGTPSGSAVEPNPQSVVTRGGEEYAAAGWYSGVRAWVGYQDLDPAWVKSLAEDKDGAFAGPVLEAERDRRVKAAGGTIDKKGTIQTTYGRGQLVVTDTPRGKRVEHYILAATGPRPRLYVVGVEAPKLDPAGPLPQKLLAGFRINGP
jgi:hypothetical protein